MNLKDECMGRIGEREEMRKELYNYILIKKPVQRAITATSECLKMCSGINLALEL